MAHFYFFIAVLVGGGVTSFVLDRFVGLGDQGVFSLMFYFVFWAGTHFGIWLEQYSRAQKNAGQLVKSEKE